jgi:hypothetical protein
VIARALPNVSVYVPPIETDPPVYTVVNFAVRSAPGLLLLAGAPQPPAALEESTQALFSGLVTGFT